MQHLRVKFSKQKKKLLRLPLYNGWLLLYGFPSYFILFLWYVVVKIILSCYVQIWDMFSARKWQVLKEESNVDELLQRDSCTISSWRRGNSKGYLELEDQVLDFRTFKFFLSWLGLDFMHHVWYSKLQNVAWNSKK